MNRARSSGCMKLLMTTKYVSPYLPEWRDLYERAFPKSEKYPLAMLQTLTCRKGINAHAFYDEGQFVALLYTVESETMVFVLYLAVNDAIRSKGYGTKILDWLKEKAGSRGIGLNIEPVDPTAQNSEQRLRRATFYTKNGIVDTGYRLGAQGQIYAVYSSAQPFVPENYTKTMGRMAFGLYRPKLKETQTE